MASITLIHHKALRDDHSYPANSYPALEFCVDRGASIIEVDIAALDGEDFLITHDSELEQFSTGRGTVNTLNLSDVGQLRLLWNGEQTGYPPMLLSQALDCIAQNRAPIELQLDLKEDGCLEQDKLALLTELVRPVRDRIRITSGADWALRRLHALDTQLPLGFDPLLYLGWDDDSHRDADELPKHEGAFGYWDDHPLAQRRWGSTERYLRERAEALWVQAPFCGVWYIAAGLLVKSMEDGFDWIQFLHERGVEVDAWTLDADKPGHLAVTQRLIEAGVNRITTNYPLAMADALAGGAVT